MKMKINGTDLIPIKAAEEGSTIYYRTNLSQIKDAFESNNVNMWLQLALEENGLDAIDTENSLFGSRIIGNELYICQTDGQDITVNGELVDPEIALEEFDIEELSDYIEEATPDIIVKHITEYEMILPDLDEGAMILLEQGKGFIDIVKSAQDVYSIDTWK